MPGGETPSAETIVVLHLSRIGDLMQALPFFRELRRNYPRAQVDCLVLEDCAEVLRAAPVDRVHTMSSGQLLRLNEEVEALAQGGVATECRALLAELRLPRPGLLINLSYAPLAGWLAARLAAGSRRGLLMDDGGRRRFTHPWDCYLYAEPNTRPANRLNLVDLWRGMIPGVSSACGFDGPRLALAETLPEALPPRPVVALNPGGSETWRRWPAERFALLAGELRQRGVACVLTGSRADRELCGAVREEAGFALPDFAGRTTLAEMARLVHDVDLLVTNDTGAVHVAAAVGTPVVGLYGDINYFPLTAPWGEGHLLLHRPLLPGAQPEPLPVAVVLAAALRQLGREETPGLENLLAEGGVEAWRTRFLDPQEDSLGGVICEPLRAGGSPVEDRFRGAVRHALADIGRTFGPWPDPGAEIESWPEDARALARAVEEYRARLVELAGLAFEAAQARESGSAEASQRLELLRRRMEQLAAPGVEFPTLQLLLLHLSVWMASLDNQPALARLRIMEEAFRRSAAILAAAWKRLRSGAAAAAGPGAIK